jgi:hypothetical protein
MGSSRPIRHPGHALALEAAYRSRIRLPFDQVFYLIAPIKALILGFSVLAWVLIGFWLNVCDRPDSGHARRVARDSLRHTALGVASLAGFQYLLRLEFPLSRSFPTLFALYSWVLPCAFRLAARNMAGLIRREFSVPHSVLVVGTGASARRLGEALERSARYGIRLAGFLGDERGSPWLGAQYPVHRLRELPTPLRRQVVDEVVCTVENQDPAEERSIGAQLRDSA